MNMEPTVVLADDHPVIRLGVRMALARGGFRVVAEASSSAEAVEAAVAERPEVCLLDVYMPGGGIDAAQRIAQAVGTTAIVMLTVSDSTEDILGALRAGAAGYLLKDMSPDRLPAALCGVLKGEAALPRPLVARVLHEFREEAQGRRIRVGEVELTTRESEIMRMLGAGMSTLQIGIKLSLSPITVRRHISAGVAKLGASDRRAAIRAMSPLAEAG
jgi:DNA-binding NarL/FixJ family response regulator